MISASPSRDALCGFPFCMIWGGGARARLARLIVMTVIHLLKAISNVQLANDSRAPTVNLGFITAEPASRARLRSV